MNGHLLTVDKNFSMEAPTNYVNSHPLTIDAKIHFDVLKIQLWTLNNRFFLSRRFLQQWWASVDFPTLSKETPFRWRNSTSDPQRTTSWRTTTLWTLPSRDFWRSQETSSRDGSRSALSPQMWICPTRRWRTAISCDCGGALQKWMVHPLQH